MSETFTATGRRKTAVARVWLTAGTGENHHQRTTPSRTSSPPSPLQGQLLEPLQVTSLKNKFDVKAVSRGGGLHGQADAIKLAIARASDPARSLSCDPPSKPPAFCAATHEPRERKKPGQPGARKRFQFSKR